MTREERKQRYLMAVAGAKRAAIAAATPTLIFRDQRMTVSSIMPGLWIGAMPEQESDFGPFGAGARVYVMRDEVLVTPTFKNAEVTHVPLVDNVDDPITVPPTIKGSTLVDLLGLAREVSKRVFVDKLPTIIVCAWGFNRSVLLGAWAMILGGRDPQETVQEINAARGKHPEGYGTVLNNRNFRALVLGAVGRPHLGV